MPESFLFAFLFKYFAVLLKNSIFTGASIIGVGEKGDEAVVPLSQKHRMKPFAAAVAEMMPEGQGETVINNYYTINATIREEADIQRLSENLNKLQERTQRAGGVRINWQSGLTKGVGYYPRFFLLIPGSSY